MMATKKLSPTFSVPTRKFYKIGFFTPIEGSAGTDNTLSFHQLSFKKKHCQKLRNSELYDVNLEPE